MQCWGQCLFFYRLVEIPPSISWNRCHGGKAVWFHPSFEHFMPGETHPDNRQTRLDIDSLAALNYKKFYFTSRTPVSESH